MRAWKRAGSRVHIKISRGKCCAISLARGGQEHQGATALQLSWCSRFVYNGEWYVNGTTPSLSPSFSRRISVLRSRNARIKWNLLQRPPLFSLLLSFSFPGVWFQTRERKNESRSKASTFHLACLSEAFPRAPEYWKLRKRKYTGVIKFDLLFPFQYFFSFFIAPSFSFFTELFDLSVKILT